MSKAMFCPTSTGLHWLPFERVARLAKAMTSPATFFMSIPCVRSISMVMAE